MRISVVGTSGSGKTTLAKQIATRFDIPFIELDAINWRPGWRALLAEDPKELHRLIDEATRGGAWVIDGNYGSTDAAAGALVRSRATHLVWLDYNRAIVMTRVIRRSFYRALAGTELWPGTGNRERWQHWLRASHPIRWAWSTWARRRAQYEALLSDSTLSHLKIIRLRRPREAASIIDTIQSSSLGRN